VDENISAGTVASKNVVMDNIIHDSKTTTYMKD
jgi:hypothetical protein